MPCFDDKGNVIMTTQKTAQPQAAGAHRPNVVAAMASFRSEYTPGSAEWCRDRTVHLKSHGLDSDGNPDETERLRKQNAALLKQFNQAATQ